MQNSGNKVWYLEDSDIELICPEEFKVFKSSCDTFSENLQENETLTKLINKFSDVTGLELEFTPLSIDDIEYSDCPDTLDTSSYVWVVTGVRDFSPKAKDLMSNFGIEFGTFSYVTYG